MVIPRPQRTTPREPGPYRLDAETSISAGSSLERVAGWLHTRLAAATGLPLPLRVDDRSKTGETGAIDLRLQPELGPEAYDLVTGASGVVIRGGDHAGVFYGAQTLLQLLPPQVYRKAPLPHVQWELPAVRIEDAPRFRWRGVMLDVARHFLPKQEVLRYLDLLALHKFNVLHLHLSDDQGWRVEIRQFPRLTSVGGWRSESQVGPSKSAPGDGRPHGGFYTQEDIAEIVAYAEQRCIQVVPEIDMPGHMQAAIAAYPELGVGSPDLGVGTRWGIIPHALNAEEATVDFFARVLDEIAGMFTSEFINVGGDECLTGEWENDPRTQELMRQRGLSEERQVQTWFITRMSAHLQSLGRRMVGWDELLEGDIPASTVVASWRGMTGVTAAVSRGHEAVACPDDRVYLDYRQSDSAEEPIPVGIPLTLARCYEFTPIPEGLNAEEADRVIGGQANIWTEHMDTPRDVDFHAFPRLCAIGEVLWSGPGGDFADFGDRLEGHWLRLDALGVEYRPAEGPQPWQKRPDVAGKPVTIAERTKLTEAMVATIATK